MDHYTDYMIEQAENLLAIDSPTGFTDKVTTYLMEEYRRLGYDPQKTVKGGVLVDLGGEGHAISVMAHVDTLGAVVAEVKSNGRLRISPAGGLHPQNTEAENCRIYTYDGKVYTGTFQLENASIHVNKDYSDKPRTYETMEVVLDEMTASAEETKKLGIRTGNFVCFEPRTVITPSGYIKSRFLDDKLSTAILLGYAKYLKEEGITPARKIYQHITVFEEVGHGGSGSVPAEVEELLSVDMGCVGDGLECTERQVSICVKDSAGPYHFEVVRGLVAAAEAAEVDFVTDIYPFYGSDADASLKAGYDVRHGLIGPGVYASHGYERSHRDGVANTFALLKSYLGGKVRL